MLKTTGRIEITKADIEILTVDKKRFARLLFNFNVFCSINGIDLEPFKTERIIQLSDSDYNKLYDNI